MRLVVFVPTPERRVGLVDKQRIQLERLHVAITKPHVCFTAVATPRSDAVISCPADVWACPLKYSDRNNFPIARAGETISQGHHVAGNSNLGFGRRRGEPMAALGQCCPRQVSTQSQRRVTPVQSN